MVCGAVFTIKIIDTPPRGDPVATGPSIHTYTVLLRALVCISADSVYDMTE
jgi:hypothetical protein